MDEQELFTVNALQVRAKATQSQNNSSNDGHDSNEMRANGGTELIEEFPNMNSARVIKGRMLELEHSNLAGPSVKFKTVVNYERILEPGSFVGVTFSPQECYKS